MYCRKCGNLLADNDQFCRKCGTKIDKEQPETQKTERTDYHMEVGTAAGTIPQHDAENITCAETENLSFVDKIILKFGNVILIIVGIVYLALIGRLFEEGGFWGTAFGILFLLAGIVSIFDGAKALFSRSKQTMSAEEVKKQKKKIGTNILIIIGLSIFISAYGGDSIYDNVKNVSFETYGTETIGEIIEDNIKSPEWSSEEIDDSSKKVYVEGYSPLYDEDIQICFYYEEDDDSYEVTLQKIVFLDSGETYDNGVDTAIIWATFYE